MRYRYVCDTSRLCRIRLPVVGTVHHLVHQAWIFQNSQGGNYTTYRRCWGRWEGCHAVGGTQALQFSKSTIDAVRESSDGRDIVETVGHLLAAPGGATILNRYENGKLTDQPLWPWPMNQRIIDAMKLAGYDDPVDVTRTVFELAGGKPPNIESPG